jgi:hypothetical protein
LTPLVLLRESELSSHCTSQRAVGNRRRRRN